MESEITVYTDNDFTITNLGYPNYNSLTKAEKRVLLLPLVENIKAFYENPENKANYEVWKTERTKNIA